MKGMHTCAAWLAFLVAWMATESAKGDFLNDYLNDKVFGENPGPCPGPTLEAGSCKGNIQDLPPSAQDLPICLLPSSNTGCGRLGDIITDGDAWIWNLKCFKIAANEITLSHIIDPTIGSVNTTLDVDDFKLSCSGNVRFENLRLEAGPAVIISTLNGVLSFEQGPNDAGISLDFDINFVPGPGDDLATELPTSVEIPYSTCDVEPDLGVQLVSQEFELIEICQNVLGFGCLTGTAALNFIGTNNVLAIVIFIIEAILGSLICQILEGAAVLDNFDPPQPGILNEVWADVKAQVDEWGESVGQNVAFCDTNTYIESTKSYSGVTDNELANSLDLSDSAIFTLVARTLNNFAGGESTNPAYAGKLRVNEILDRITDPDGEVLFDMAELLGAEPKVSVPLDITDLSVTLKQIVLTGINSLETFQVLDNLGNLKRSVANTLSLRQVGLRLVTEIELAPGEWVTSGTTVGTYVFDFDVTTDDFLFTASLLQLTNPSEISSLRIGQVFDINLDSDNVQDAVMNSVRCVMPMFYALNFTDIQASIGPISNPQVTFDESGLSQLFQDGTEIFAEVFRGALQNKFPGIVNGPVRELLNEVLLEETIAARQFGTSRCAPLTQRDQMIQDFVSFKGPVFDFIFAVITDGVGGDPVEDTGTDINDLVQLLIESFEDVPGWPVVSSGPQGDWDFAEDFQKLISLEKLNDSSSTVNFFNLKLTGVNSINKLVLDRESSDFLRGTLGLGGPLADGIPREIKLSGTLQVDAQQLNMLERADFELVLKDISFDFALSELAVFANKFYALRFDDLTKPSCLFSLLGSIVYPNAFRDGKIGGIEFYVSNRQSNGNSNSLNAALTQLALETPSPRAQAFINTLARAGLDVVLDGLETVPDYYAGLDADSCTRDEGTLDAILEIAQRVPNITELAGECTAPVEALPPISETERQVVIPEGGTAYNLQDSTILPIVADAINGLGSGDTVRDILTAFANSSDTTLQRSFIYEDDGSITLALPLYLLDALSFVYDGVPGQGGFSVVVQELKIYGIDKLVNSFEVLKVLSKYTSQGTLNFDGDIALDIELVTEITFDGDAIGEPGTTLVEVVNIDFVLDKLDATLDLLTAFDVDALSEKSVAHFLKVDREQAVSLQEFAFDCVFDSFFENGILIRRLDVQIPEENLVNVGVRTRSGDVLSQGMELGIAAASEIITNFYLSGINNIFENCVKVLINDFLEEWRSESVSCPALNDIPAPPLEGENQMLRFSVSDGYRQFQDYLNDFLGSDNELGSLNVLVNSFFSRPLLAMNDQVDNSIGLATPLIYNQEFYGDIEVKIGNIELKNFGSFRKFLLGVPFEEDGTPQLPAQVNDEIRPGQPEFTTLSQFEIDGPATFKLEIIFNAQGLFQDIESTRNRFTVEVKLTDLVIELLLLLELNIPKFLRTRLSSLSSLEELPCVLAPLDDLRFFDFNLTTSSVDIGADCTGGCDLPFLNSLQEAGVSFETDTEIGRKLSSLVNRFIVYLGELLDSGGFQDSIGAALVVAEDECSRLLELAGEFIDTFEPEPYSNVALTFLYLFVSSFALGGIASVCVVPWLHRRNKARNLNRVLSKGGLKDANEVANDVALHELEQSSLFAHPGTPQLAKYLVPGVLFINIIGLGIAILAAPFSDLLVSVTIVGATTVPVNLVPFDASSTVNDFWNSGSWPLAILVVVGSCIWPVVKNLVLMGLWFAPATLLPVKWRYKIGDILDILGKWSFIDVYVVVVSLAALYTYISGAIYAEFSFLDPEFFVVTINMVPKSGLILLSTVAATSLAINHVVIYYHLKAIDVNRRAMDTMSGNALSQPGRRVPPRAQAKRKLAKHVFFGANTQGQERVVSDRKVAGVAAATVLGMIMILAGICLPIITFRIDGALGIFLEELSTNSIPGAPKDLHERTFSIIGMCAKLTDAPVESTGDQLVIYMFQFLFAAAVFVAPIVLLTMCLVTLFYPTSFDESRKVYFWLKVSSYWCALDVFLISMTAATFQIQAIVLFITDYVTNSFCTKAEAIIASTVDDPEKDGYCVMVDAVLETEAIIIFTGLFLLMFCFLVVVVLARAVIDDRYWAAYREHRDDARRIKPSRLTLYILDFMTDKRPSTQPSITELARGDTESGAARAAAMPARTSRAATRQSRVEPQQNSDEVVVDSCCSCLYGGSPQPGSDKISTHISTWQQRVRSVQPGSIPQESAPSRFAPSLGPRQESQNPRFSHVEV